MTCGDCGLPKDAAAHQPRPGRCRFRLDTEAFVDRILPFVQREVSA